MAKKGIRIKDLARQLGLTSRDLLDRCRAQGIKVQNSITKLNREAELKIRALVQSCEPEETPAPRAAKARPDVDREV